MLHVAGLFAVSLLLGGMVFFAAVVARLVFTWLPADQSGPFIRAVFPHYYGYVTILSAAAGLALTPSPAGDVMGLVAVASIALRFWLMPRINRASDAARAGDARAKRRFDLGHRVSVLVNIAQMLAAGAVLARLAAPAAG